MSLREPSLLINLTPRPPRQPLSHLIGGYWQLLRWILWDPRALEAYIERYCPANAVQWDEPINWRQRVSLTVNRLITDNRLQHHLSHFMMWVIICLLFVALATAILVSGVASRMLLVSQLLAIWTYGLVLAYLFILIGVYTNHLALLEIWAFHVGVSLPVLIVQEDWLSRDGIGTKVWLLALFGISSGLFVGILLNNLRGIIERILQTEHGRGLSYYLQSILLLFYIFILLLYFGNSRTIVTTWQAIICGLLSLCAVLLAMVRIDDYLLAKFRLPTLQAHLSNRFTGDILQELQHLIPRVTYLAPRQLDEWFAYWLESDEQVGLENARQLWQYTNLQSMVANQIGTTLAKEADGDRLLRRIEQFSPTRGQGLGAWITQGSSNPERWRFEDFLDPNQRQIYYLSIEQLMQRVRRFTDQDKTEAGRSAKQRRLDYRIGKPEPRADENAKEVWRAVIAGYIHLQTLHVEKATVAFRRVKSSLAKELEKSSVSLTKLLQEENLLLLRPPILPAVSVAPNYQWSEQALAQFRQIHHHLWLLRRCRRFCARRVLRREILYSFIQLNQWHNDEPSATAIEYIHEQWHTEFQNFSFGARVEQMEQVANPFIYTQPLDEDGPFVGRTAELAQLQIYNTLGNASVILLSGTAKVGKTSLLNQFTARNRRQVITINLYTKGIRKESSTLRTVAQVICESIATAFNEPVPNINMPTNEALNYLRSYITRACNRRPNRLLVLIIDDLTELILERSPNNLHVPLFIPPYLDNFMTLLWHLVQNMRNFNVTFVTRQTPAFIRQHPTWGQYDMLNNAQPIEIRNLNKQSIVQLLNRPTENFLPHFARETVTTLYQNTNGHPLLVQMTANFLVQEFNQRIAAGQSVDPVFMNTDLATVRQNDELRQAYNRCRR